MITIGLPSFKGLAVSVVKVKLVGAAMGLALKSEADKVVAEMKGRVSSSPSVESGDLRDSIKAEREGNEITISAGGEATTKRGGDGRPYDHALAVEYGTQNMPAEPFFWPTIRAHSRKLGPAVAGAAKGLESESD